MCEVAVASLPSAGHKPCLLKTLYQFAYFGRHEQMILL